MAFKEVASLDADNVVALGKSNKSTGKPYPKQAEGYYLGSRSVENKRGESKIHFLQTPKGNLGLWGTTDLNRKMLQVPVGTMIRVTSTGTKPTPNGDMYTYKVEQDTDNTIEVASVSENPHTGSSFETVEEDSDEDGGDTEEYTTADADQEDDAQDTALAAAAARKAKVQALMNKGKTK